VWLRREDKLRQAISWWRAAATGQYGLAPGEVPAEPPEFDRDAIGRLLRYAQAGEAGWRDWFAAHSIRPLEIVYEDLIQDVDQAARNVAGFLGVSMRCGQGPVRPRMRRQADHHTERLAELFNRPADA
jgi:LPS sulfotransferase NodH